MFRRPPHAQPPGPLGLDDLEAAPRPPLISRRAIGRAIALFLGGIAWGAAVRLADSLPVDAGFIAFVLKVGVGFVFVLAIALVLLFRGFEVDRVALAVLFTVAGASIGLNAGPTVAPPSTVVGAFSFAPSVPTGLPSTRGAVDCEWAAGRWKVGALRTAPIDGLRPAAAPHHRLPAQDDEPGRRRRLHPDRGRQRRVRVACPTLHRVARAIGAACWTSRSCR